MDTLFTQSIIVMGVSGCGKTTVGRAIADKLQLPFHDADQFHPQANIDKMSLGVPLTDEDRQEWLESMGEMIAVEQAVYTCSALKVQYRAILESYNKSVWVYLDGSYDLILERLATRTDHFMPSSLLQSQFDTLEKPDMKTESLDKLIVVSVAEPVEVIVENVLMSLL